MPCFSNCKAREEMKRKRSLKPIKCPMCDHMQRGKVGERIVCEACGFVFRIIKRFKED